MSRASPGFTTKSGELTEDPGLLVRLILQDLRDRFLGVWSLGAKQIGEDVGSRTADEFLALVERHDEGLRRMAYRLLGQEQAMEDALQDAYLRAFRGLRSYRGPGEPVAWLYRIVYNSCIDRIRREKRSLPADPDDLAQAVERPGGMWTSGAAGLGRDPAEQVSARLSLSEALATLSAEQQAAVLLVDAQGFDQLTAAEIMGVRPGTLASRLHYARRALRRALTPEPVRQ